MDGEKSILKGSKEEAPDVFIRDIKPKDKDENQDAADSCPVNCIHVED
jgi:ferredoxin